MGTFKGDLSRRPFMFAASAQPVVLSMRNLMLLPNVMGGDWLTLTGTSWRGLAELRQSPGSNPFSWVSSATGGILQRDKGGCADGQLQISSTWFGRP